MPLPMPLWTLWALWALWKGLHQVTSACVWMSKAISSAVFTGRLLGCPHGTQPAGAGLS